MKKLLSLIAFLATPVFAHDVQVIDRHKPDLGHRVIEMVNGEFVCVRTGGAPSVYQTETVTRLFCGDGSKGVFSERQSDGGSGTVSVPIPTKPEVPSNPKQPNNPEQPSNPENPPNNPGNPNRPDCGGQGSNCSGGGDGTNPGGGGNPDGSNNPGKGGGRP